MQHNESSSLFTAANKVIPGGVNSPVRAFKGVGGDPIFIASAKGATLTDVDGNDYVDYIGSWGPMIVGHQHPEVISAVKSAIDNGLSFGAPTAVEITIAEKICHIFPSIDLVRMVNSGTEATMSAIRLARGFTGRNKIIKFTGCYHGHVDSLLVKAGSGALTLGVPTSPGISPAVAQDTLTLPYNDIEAVNAAFAEYHEEIAAIIVEPVAGNMNCIPPQPDFLQGLRTACDKHSAVLIFDEVMTGFRVALGGAQQRFNIKPDLTCLGKIMGGGMPVGAFGGKQEIMEHISPLGPVYQAGTLSGNPVAMAAGLKTLELISQPGFHDNIEAKTTTLLAGLNAAAKENKIDFLTQQVGPMFGLFFTSQTSVNNFDEINACDTEKFQRFFHLMLEGGIYLAPSAYEAGFMSAAHTDTDIEKTIAAANHAFKNL